MGTSLIVISNHSLDLADIEEVANRLLPQIVLLDLPIAINYSGVRESKEWAYSIWIESKYPQQRRIKFDGPCTLFLCLYKDLVEISTIYGLYVLYENYKLDYFRGFREALFKLVKLLGGNEVIYLADNNNPLAAFHGMTIDGMGYLEVKRHLMEKFGKPVKDFSLLNRKELDYGTMNEFFLDTFADLK